MPVFECTTVEAITWCRQFEVRTMAATPHAERLYTHMDMCGTLALVVGTEQYGLSHTWLAEADEQIKLPMYGTAK